MVVLQDEDEGVQVIYRQPSSLRNTYDIQHCRLLDQLDNVMAKLAQKATQ